MWPYVHNQVIVRFNLGVAIGAGWQNFVAYMNAGCYFLLGVPFGTLMCYKFDMGVKVTWSSFFFFFFTLCELCSNESHSSNCIFAHSNDSLIK